MGTLERILTRPTPRMGENMEGLLHGEKSTLWAEVLLSIYFLLTHLHYNFGFEGALGFVVVGAFNLIGIHFFFLMMIKHRNFKVVLFCSFMFLIGLVSNLYTKNGDIVYYLTLFRYTGIALYLLFEPRNKKIITILMYITLLLFIPVIIRPLGFTSFLRVSRNYHSVVLLPVNFVYNLFFIERRKPINLIPTVISLFICIFSLGRGGIIAYSIFFLGALVYNFQISKIKISRCTKKKILSVFTTLLIAILFLSILLVKNNIDQANVEKSKKSENSQNVVVETNSEKNSFVGIVQSGFSEKGLSSPERSNLIKTYLNLVKEDFNNFLFGVPLSSDVYFERFKLNLHNSYLELHSKFGIFGFLSMFALGIYALIKLVKTRNWGLGLMLTAFCARIFVDKAALLGHLDVILLLFFLQYFLNNDESILNNNFRKNMKSPT